MQLLPAANYAFAKEGCYRCGRGGPVVDMDAVIEGEGTLALCDHCIGEAAQVAGFRVTKQKPKGQ